jgi:hypothetical protein
MRLKYKSFLLFAVLFSCLLSNRRALAQSQLSFQVEATTHPVDFLFFEGSSFDELYDFWPMLEARLTYTQVLGTKKQWRWQTGFNYRFTQLNTEKENSLIFADEVDPYFGFFGVPDFETYHWLGLQGGIEHRFNRNKGWKNFWLGAGAMAQLPIAG